MSETIATSAGVILSLAFAYIPGLKSWYSNCDTTRKAAIMAIFVIIAGIVVYMTGTDVGMDAVIKSVINVLIGNVATYQAIVRPFKNGNNS